MLKKTLTFLFLWAVLITPVQGLPLIVDTVTKEMPLLPELLWLSDAAQEQTIESVSAPQNQGAFASLRHGFPLRLEGPVWVKLSLVKAQRSALASKPAAPEVTLTINLGAFGHMPATLYMRGSGTEALAHDNWAEHSIAPGDTLTLPPLGGNAQTAYIRFAEAPGPWFHPTIQPLENLNAQFLPPEPLLPGLFVLICAVCLLRALKELAIWRFWAALFLGCILVQILMPLPLLHKQFDYLDLPALLAPGFSLLLLPHLGRLMLSTNKNAAFYDKMLLTYSLLGAAVALAPLIPGYAWLAKLFPLWPLLLLPLLPVCFWALQDRRQGALPFTAICIMPFIGALITFFAIDMMEIPHPLTINGSFWGLAVGSIGLAFARPRAKKEKKASLDIDFPLLQEGTQHQEPEEQPANGDAMRSETAQPEIMLTTPVTPSEAAKASGQAPSALPLSNQEKQAPLTTASPVSLFDLEMANDPTAPIKPSPQKPSVLDSVLQAGTPLNRWSTPSFQTPRLDTPPAHQKPVDTQRQPSVPPQAASTPHQGQAQTPEGQQPVQLQTAQQTGAPQPQGAAQPQTATDPQESAVPQHVTAEQTPAQPSADQTQELSVPAADPTSRDAAPQQDQPSLVAEPAQPKQPEQEPAETTEKKTETPPVQKEISVPAPAEGAISTSEGHPRPADETALHEQDTVSLAPPITVIGPATTIHAQSVQETESANTLQEADKQHEAATSETAQPPAQSASDTTAPAKAQTVEEPAPSPVQPATVETTTEDAPPIAGPAINVPLIAPEEKAFPATPLDFDEPGHEVFKLSVLIKHLGQTLAPKVKEKGLIFSWVIDPRLPSLLKGDVVSLNSILYGLLQDSIEATEAGFVQLTIRCQNPTDAPKIPIAFFVTDTGPDRPEADSWDKARIFASQAHGSFEALYSSTRGFQTSLTLLFGVIEEPGTLAGPAAPVAAKPALTRETKEHIAKAINASRQDNPAELPQPASPETMAETTRKLQQEMTEAIHAPSAQAMESFETVAGQHDTPSVNILVSDMTTTNIRLISYYLTQYRYPHEEIRTEGQLRDYFRNGRADLVIVDADMPEDEVQQSIDIIKKAGQTGTTSILALISHKGQKERVLALGCDYTIAKPFSQEEFIKAVQHCVPKLRVQPSSEPDAVVVSTASEEPQEKPKTVSTEDYVTNLLSGKLQDTKTAQGTYAAARKSHPAEHFLDLDPRSLAKDKSSPAVATAAQPAFVRTATVKPQSEKLPAALQKAASIKKITQAESKVTERILQEQNKIAAFINQAIASAQQTSEGTSTAPVPSAIPQHGARTEAAQPAPVAMQTASMVPSQSIAITPPAPGAHPAPQATQAVAADQKHNAAQPVLITKAPAPQKPAVPFKQETTPLIGLDGEAIYTDMLPLVPRLFIELKEGLSRCDEGIENNQLPFVNEIIQQIIISVRKYGLQKLAKIADCVGRAAAAGDAEAVATMMTELHDSANRHIAAIETCYHNYLNYPEGAL